MRRLLFGLLLAAVAAQASAVSPPLPEAPLGLDEVAPGVLVHQGRQEGWLPISEDDIANVAVIIGKRCIAVIDTGASPVIGRRLKLAIALTTALPVCYVINTHAHFDHVLGNAAFAKDARTQFVANAHYAAALTAREGTMILATKRDLRLDLTPSDFVIPTLEVTLGKPLELDLGGRTLRVEAWPTAHTDNDLTVYDEQTKTLILGDLLFAGHLPVVDGKLRGWLAVMETLHARRDVALAVPGHGPISRDWPAALDAQTRYLQALQRDVRAAIQAGLPLQKAVDTVPCDGASSWLLVDRFHKRNVTAAFAELEWED